MSSGEKINIKNTDNFVIVSSEQSYIRKKLWKIIEEEKENCANAYLISTNYVTNILHETGITETYSDLSKIMNVIDNIVEDQLVIKQYKIDNFIKTLDKKKIYESRSFIHSHRSEVCQTLNYVNAMEQLHLEYVENEKDDPPKMLFFIEFLTQEEIEKYDEICKKIALLQRAKQIKNIKIIYITPNNF